jgi:hypothetical protein
MKKMMMRKTIKALKRRRKGMIKRKNKNANNNEFFI